ncbi:MAG: DUF87 domain-containing protein [Candidatus Altiarchaeota archaeon]
MFWNRKPKEKTDEELIEEARIEEGQRMARIVLPSLIQNRMNEIKTDDKWRRIKAADGYPRSVSDGWLDKLVSMSGNFDLAMHIEPIETNNVIRLLNKELRKQGSDINALAKKGEIIPTSLQIQNEDTKNVLRIIQKGEEKMFNVSIYVAPKADSLEELELLTKRVNATLNSVMIQPRIPTMRMLDGLKSIMPFAQDKLKITRNITSSALAACFPFTTSGLKIEENGVMFGVNTDNKIPIIIDPFNMNNPNGLILATSGAGKSFFVKIFEIRQLLMGTTVINLDPQGEYAKLTEAYGGQSIKISKDSDTVINPFDMMGMDYADKTSSLHSLMHTIVEDLTSPQQALLDDAFRRIYLEAGITEEKHTWGNTPPTFGELYSVIKEKESDGNHLTRASAMALANRLRMFTEGSLKFLNQQTDLDFDNRMVTFDISQVPKLAKPAMMYTMLEYILHKMKHDIQRKVFVIDEAWLLLQHPQAAERIFEIVKTSRKYNMSFIIITQEVNDLLNSQAGNSVLANTAWKLLLRQDPSVIDGITKTFKLNYAETMLLMNAQPGEGLLMAYNNRIPLKVIASKREYDIVTTKPDDILKREQKQEKPKEEVQPVEPRKRFNITKKVQLKNDLNKGQIDILLRDGFKEVREPGFGAGRGYLYLIKNGTGELDQHFIMWNLIYEEIRKRTDKVSYHLTKEPDIVFETDDGRTIAFEIESTLKTESRLMEKLNVLQKYDEWYFIVTQKTTKTTTKNMGQQLPAWKY